MTRRSGSFPFLLQIFQHFQQELPGPFSGRNLQFFPAGVDVVHLGSDGNAVQTRQLFTQQAALKTCVNGQHLGLVAEHFGVDAHHGVPEVGILLELPGGVLAHLGISALIEFAQGLQLAQNLLLLAVDGAADREGGGEAVAQLGDAHVQAGLYQAFDILTHGLDAVGCGAQQADDLGGGLGRQAVAAQSVYVESLNGGFRLVVGFPDFRLQLLRDGSGRSR